MKKLAVVLGVAAVATFTGCRDQDYDAKHGKQVQDEMKTIETTPSPEVTTTTTVETTTVKTTEIKVEPQTPVVKPTPVPPPEPETTVYVVQNGDYLSKISKKYNVTISSIKRLNNLKDDKIRVGQKLKLPGKIDVGVQAAPAPAATLASARKGYAPYTGATKEYVVKNGDTLGAVAYGNGINIRQLKQLNNLTSDSLKIGQKLKVPAEKVTKTVVATSTTEKKVVTAPAPAKVEPAKVEPAKPAETPVSVAPAPTADVAPAPAEATPAPTAAETPAPAPVATTTYVVQEGEDLTRLSIDFGVSTSVIREMNNLGENDTIKPGQVLKLPAESQQ